MEKIFRIKNKIEEPPDIVKNILEKINAMIDRFEESTGKHYGDGTMIFQGDKITCHALGEGIVIWSQKDLCWAVEITKSSGGSIIVGNHEPLKKFFKPTKIS
jgi:hypothetical protein